MPYGQPFTRLCRELTENRPERRVDLHLHTTYSDGQYTPAQVVDLARRSGLPALAITDHDTCAGVEPARAAAAGTALEVIAGAEITTEHRGNEVHLLAYFIGTDDSPLSQALLRLRRARLDRFLAMVERLASKGVCVDPGDVDALAQRTTLGRRHLAELLVKAKKVDTIRQAFQRYLHDYHPNHVAKTRLPIAEACALVREAGGVSSWAHPGADCTLAALAELRALGLDAVEVDFPACRASRERELRQWARQLGLAVTGGSDCHGFEPASRAIGSGGITLAELDALRQLACSPQARSIRPAATKSISAMAT
jgi:predicted metal-dependent phosphoesterase TrpH